MAGRPPFSRQRRRDGERSEWTIVRAAEYAARDYGWGPDYLDVGLTDEQLVAYLDAASERLTDDAQARFDEAIEAVRVGTIFAHDAKQYARWQTRPSKRVPAGRDLAKLALELGGQVVHGEFEFRN